MKKILPFTVFLASLVLLLATCLRQLKQPLLAIFPLWPRWASWIFKLPETPPLGPYGFENSWPTLVGLIGIAVALLLNHRATRGEKKGGGDEI